MFFYIIIYYTRYSPLYLYFFYFLFTTCRHSITMSRTAGSTSDPYSPWVEKLPISSPPYSKTYTPVLSSIEEEDTSDPFSLLFETTEIARLFNNIVIDDGEALE
jgi:hypothetical protein